jgi:hypothetical protein
LTGHANFEPLETRGLLSGGVGVEFPVAPPLGPPAPAFIEVPKVPMPGEAAAWSGLEGKTQASIGDEGVDWGRVPHASGRMMPPLNLKIKGQPFPGLKAPDVNVQSGDPQAESLHTASVGQLQSSNSSPTTVRIEVALVRRPAEFETLIVLPRYLGGGLEPHALAFDELMADFDPRGHGPPDRPDRLMIPTLAPEALALNASNPVMVDSGMSVIEVDSTVLEPRPTGYVPATESVPLNAIAQLFHSEASVPLPESPSNLPPAPMPSPSVTAKPFLPPQPEDLDEMFAPIGADLLTELARLDLESLETAVTDFVSHLDVLATPLIESVNEPSVVAGVLVALVAIDQGRRWKRRRGRTVNELEWKAPSSVLGYM